MAHTVKQIADALGAECFGDTSIILTGASEPAAAGPETLALAMSPAYAEGLAKGRARVAVLWPGADWQALGLKAAIIAPRARLAMARLTQMLDTAHDIDDGIHPTALIGEGAQIGDGVAIGPFSVIGRGARIGAGTRIAGHVTVNAGVEIGADCLILDGARLLRRVRLGDRVMLHPGVVLGGDGFSFVTSEVSNVERARSTLGEAEMVVPTDATQHRIHSLGGVEIGDDVEIGSNTTVDAGTIRATKIGRGTKIDNLCHIGHNALIGQDCLLAGQSAVAGSAVLGDRVVMGGKAGVADNITVGDDCVLTGASVNLSNVPAGRVMMGYPATKIDVAVESYKALRRLPRLLRDLKKG